MFCSLRAGCDKLAAIIPANKNLGSLTLCQIESEQQFCLQMMGENLFDGALALLKFEYFYGALHAAV
jgi:hypothetical protein